MKPRFAVGLILIFFFSIVALHSRPQTTSEEEGRILALETAWNHAEQNKDVGALDQLLSPQFVSIDYDGSISTKQEYLASVKSEDLSPALIINEQQTVRVFGDCAVVNGIYREKGLNKGKPYNRRGRFTDTWIKTSGTWQCVASQSTLIQH
ncbi:MAG TPA: nuclear transport factor 2 family protein [Candidatus Acidoferrales bacterium]|jgi:ketosteroid isomerase-like protein|nr:nuclear transport factor 2 family protein [Candidatus Acidoferrales bacterium]